MTTVDQQAGSPWIVQSGPWAARFPQRALVELARLAAAPMRAAPREELTAARLREPVWLLARGWAMSFRDFSDGRRHVVGIHTPGDMVGLAELWTGAEPPQVSALSPVLAVPFEAAEMRQAARGAPELFAGLATMLAETAVDLSKRLSSVARQSAYEQVAYLLWALLWRTQAAPPRDGQVFACPLAQQVMADALGLSVVHVNRSLRRLTRDGVLRKDTQEVQILDAAAFERIARL